VPLPAVPVVLLAEAFVPVAGALVELRFDDEVELVAWPGSA
jgi:hypothetical protein